MQTHPPWSDWEWEAMMKITIAGEPNHETVFVLRAPSQPQIVPTNFDRQSGPLFDRVSMVGSAGPAPSCW